MVLATSMLLISTTLMSGGLSTTFIDNYSFAIFAAVGLHYLSYPFLGLLGEKWMRYNKVILVGIILMFVGFFIVVVTLVVLNFTHLNGIAVVSICLGFSPATSATIARWIKSALTKAGIDTSICKAHSVREATTMAAPLAGISIPEILEAGDWSSQSVFERFYYRPHMPSFGQVVLSRAFNLQG